MSSTDMLAAAGGEMGKVQVAMLRQAQDMEQSQAAQLVAAIPKSASVPGVGGGVDVTA